MSQVPEAIGTLLADLESPDPRRRDAAALHLRDFAESAVDALFRAAGRPENRNHRGTLVHTLSAFHCEDHFSDLFNMALHGNYEVQCHALSILQGQWFRSYAVGVHVVGFCPWILRFRLFDRELQITYRPHIPMHL